MTLCTEEITPNCDECFEVGRSDSDLTFIYGLTPLAQYYLQVIDKFNTRFTTLFNAGADGSFTINPADSTYNNGMFNPYAGDFEINISSDAAGDTLVPMTIYATEYNCVILTILSSSEITCTAEPKDNCAPAYLTDSDGVTQFEVASGESGVCTPCGAVTTFNMIVNDNGAEIYNETWDALDTNIININ